MGIARSRLTSQGQVSVPAEIRRRLGLAPGSIIEWAKEGDHVTIRRIRRYSMAEVPAVLFPEGTPSPRSLDELKEGLRRQVAGRHARR